jgi:hypothetical protein
LATSGSNIIGYVAGQENIREQKTIRSGGSDQGTTASSIDYVNMRFKVAVSYEVAMRP